MAKKIVNKQPQYAAALKIDRRWNLAHNHATRPLGAANPTVTYSGTAATAVRANGVALAINAAGDFLSYGVNTGLQLSICSGVCCARLPPTPVTHATVFNSNYYGVTNGLALNIYSDGTVALNKNNAAGIISASNVVPPGTLTNIAWSYNSTTGRARLAVNGVLYAATSAQTIAHGTFARGRYYSTSTVNSNPHEQYLLAISPDENFSDAQLIADSLNPWRIYVDNRPILPRAYLSPAIKITPEQGIIALSGQMPTAAAGAKNYPGQGEILLSGHAPILSMDAVRITPTQGSLALSGQSAALVLGYAGTPNIGTINFAGQEAALSIGYADTAVQGDIIITGGLAKHSSDTVFAHPQQCAIVATGQYPAVKLGQAISPGCGTITVSGQAPLFADRVLKPIPPAWLATRYRCYLTGSAELPDLELPISSFQTRISGDSMSYLSCILKGADNYTDEIALRSTGQLRVFRVYALSDGSESTYMMASVLFEQIDLSSGGRSGVTAQLSGTGNMVPATAKAMTLQNPSYFGLSGGKHRYRCELDPRLRPGDTVTVNNDTFVVGGITHIVDTRFEMMEISEA